MPGSQLAAHDVQGRPAIIKTDETGAVVIWGNNPCHIGGTFNGMMPGELDDRLRKGCKLIVADPGKIDYADKADLCIRPKPGLDGLPALGMIKVIIESKKGRIVQKLKVNDELDPRVIMPAFGWWYPEEKENLYAWKKSNLNVLVDGAPEERSTGAVQLRGIPCRISKG
jgi:anaerobic selenocysteine-containing dehydrogenase